MGDFNRRSNWGPRFNKPAVVNTFEEFPQWVRACSEEFKASKAQLTHELRTLQNWRKFHLRLVDSPYRSVVSSQCAICKSQKSRSSRPLPPDRCTCHKDFLDRLPLVDTRLFPAELLEARFAEGDGESKEKKGKKRKAAPTSPTSRVRVKQEPSNFALDDAAAAIFGDELEAGPSVEDDAEKEGPKDAGGEAAELRAGGKDDDDEDEPDEDEDLGAEDYENAAEQCDDDEDLVDEGGGGSEDEEARYGTY